MLFGRGQLIEQGDTRRLVITLDIHQKLPKLPPAVRVPALDLDLENERALNNVRRRINDLLDANVDITPIRKGKTTLTAVFVKRTIAWRDLKCLCSQGNDRSNFVLPDVFFSLQRLLREEFLRGFGDVAVTPSFSDNAWGTHARVAFPVVHDNITFAKQLVELFDAVDIEAKLLEGDPRKHGGTKREHRIRVFAEEYERVGFHFAHKQKLVALLAEHNRRQKRRATK